MNTTVNYFKGNELSANVYLSKYAMRDKQGKVLEDTPDLLHQRLAEEFFKAESNYPNSLSKETIFGLLKDFKYIIPQGSVMSQLGHKYQIGSLSNCIVVPKIYDSYGGILYTDQQLSQLMKRRCGVGADISTIRPATAEVTNSAGSSTGAISFMERFSSTTREVAQNGRRGALMLTIDIKHPDVAEFVAIKKDLTKVTGANISVKISDEFMRAVKQGGIYVQQFPIDARDVVPNDETEVWEIGKLYEGETKGTYFRLVNAKSLWDEIIMSAWTSAEPGLIFWDRQHDYSPSSIYPKYKNISTNPCCFYVGEEVFVITNNGIKEIKTVTKKDKVWLDDKKIWAETSGYFNVGEHPYFEVKLSNGESLFITANHKLAKFNEDGFQLEELKNLSIGDKIKLSENKVEGIKWSDKGLYEDGLILGWLTGDGALSFKSKTSAFPDTILSFWEREHDIVPMFENIINGMGVKSHETLNKVNNNNVKRIVSSNLTEHFTYKFQENLWKFKSESCSNIFSYSKEFIKGYISSYFTADGTITDNVNGSRYAIQLASIYKKRLEEVKYLLNLFGIKSSIGVLRREGTSTFRGKEYATKTCYRLTISGRDNLIKFIEEFNFISEFKKTRAEKMLLKLKDMEQYISQSTCSIVDIIFVGNGEVGCINVPEYGYFTANGLVSGNSEIAMSFDSCRLISHNYFSYVVNPFTPNAHFDFELFKEHVRMGMRLMDDLVDLELIAIQKIIEKIDSDPEPEYIKQVERQTWQELYEMGKSGRRTGFGFTAMGDALAGLGLRYTSQEALDMMDKIGKTKLEAELESMIQMAKERGAFPDFDAELERADAQKEGSYLGMIKNEFPELFEEMMIHGRRNISWSTVAPNGSLSMISSIGEGFNVTSGIEPMFNTEPNVAWYVRRKKINPNDVDAKIDFIDAMGDKWTEFRVFHQGFIEWARVNHPDVDLQTIDKLSLVALLQESPYGGSGASEIDWQKRVEVQGIIQKYISHSISSTINLPNDVSKSVISDIYMQSWKLGLKGITVYRDGSRSGVLISETAKKTDEFTTHNAPKRPRSLECELFMPVAKGRRWLVVVGLFQGKPYEVFTFPYDEQYAHITNFHTGNLEKVRRGVYNLVTKGGTIYDITNMFESDEDEVVTRLISTALRHGSDIKFVCEQLDKSYGSIVSFSKAISRTLKKYTKEHVVQVLNERMCDDQNEQCNIVREEGCTKCLTCGIAKCS